MTGPKRLLHLRASKTLNRLVGTLSWTSLDKLLATMSFFSTMLLRTGTKRKHDFDDVDRQDDTETVERRTPKKIRYSDLAIRDHNHLADALIRDDYVVELTRPARSLEGKHQVSIGTSPIPAKNATRDYAKATAASGNADTVLQSSLEAGVTIGKGSDCSSPLHESRDEPAIWQARIAELEARNGLLESTN